MYLFPIFIRLNMNENDSYNKLDERELLMWLQQGDQAAYRALFDRYYTILCKQAALRLNGDMVSAEDVVQQVFIDFWVQEKYKVVETSLPAYLGRMVQFKAVDHIRKKVTRREYEEAVDNGHVVNDDQNDPAMAADLQKALRLAIAKLPDQCRNIFAAVYIDGKKYKEAADEYGVSINTVKEQLKRAMSRLRATLKDFAPILILLITGALSPIIHFIND